MTISMQEWTDVFEAEPIEELHVVHAAFLLYDRSMSPERGWKVGFTSRQENGDVGPSITLQDRELAHRLGLPLLDMGDNFDDVAAEYYQAYMLGVMRQPEAQGWFVPHLAILDLAYTGARGTYSGRTF